MRKTMSSRINGYLKLVSEALTKGLEMNEPIRKASLSEKLSPSCQKDKNYLKH